MVLLQDRLISEDLHDIDQLSNENNHPIYKNPMNKKTRELLINRFFPHTYIE